MGLDLKPPHRPQTAQCKFVSTMIIGVLSMRGVKIPGNPSDLDNVLHRTRNHYGIFAYHHNLSFLGLIK